MKTLSCCRDPLVLGGKCVNCDTWVVDLYTVQEDLKEAKQMNRNLLSTDSEGCGLVLRKDGWVCSDYDMPNDRTASPFNSESRGTVQDYMSDYITPWGCGAKYGYAVNPMKTPYAAWYYNKPHSLILETPE